MTGRRHGGRMKGESEERRWFLLRKSPLSLRFPFLPFEPLVAVHSPVPAVRARGGVFLALLVVVFATCAGSPAFADITLVRLFPEAPMESDTVRVLVHGLFLDDCWSVQVCGCGAAPGDSMTIDVYAADSFDGGFCAPAFVPYAFECQYGRMSAGHYLIPVREHRDSVRYPPLDWTILEFDVAPSTPSENLSWGRIRVLYR